MERIGVIYEMILRKNPVSVPEYWSTLLAKLEDELNIGWATVSKPLDEKQAMLKKIVTTVHQAVEEAEDARTKA